MKTFRYYYNGGGLFTMFKIYIIVGLVQRFDFFGVTFCKMFTLHVLMLSDKKWYFR